MPKYEHSQKSKAKAPARRARVRPRWTSEEITILKRLYRTHSNAEIAKVLGRKVSSVVFKGHRLGLAKGIRRLKEMGRENIRRRWKAKSAKASSRPTAARATKGRGRKAHR
jgi:DNA-binding CsgD family transcriptional regulator